MAVEKYIKNYINGALVPAISGKYLDNINPATGRVYAQFPDCNKDDIAQSIEFATRAFPEWAAMEAERRCRILLRIADIIEQNLSDYARAESIDTGKPMAMSISKDIPEAQECFRYYATALRHHNTAQTTDELGSFQLFMRQPIGVVACIVSWGLPLLSLCQKIAPALASGNCVIAKPSEHTPMSAYLLAQACEEAGLPKGVFAVIQGKDRLIDDIIEHPNISAISFTGDAILGKKIIDNPSVYFKKRAVNIGGNNANLIFEDCNFDQMMIGTLRSSFSNNGHLQHHASRILVERKLYEKFKTELVKRTQFLKVGDPFSSITDLGAIISEGQINKLKSWITLAELDGGTVLCGGKTLALTGDLEKGLFFRPAVIEGVNNESKLNQEPIFGPIVSLQVFDTLEEAVALANLTQYGLSASIWTKDLSKASQTARQLKARTIWVNSWLTPHQNLISGGLIYTNFAAEGGTASLDFFTEEKNIVMKY